MKIGITGDTHGEITLATFYRAKKLGFTHLVICGDFGYIFGGTKSESDRLDRINILGLKVFFCDGNHENFDLLEKYQIKDWNGGKVQYIRSNIIHLMRGEIYNFFGYKLFVMGGAYSTDKEYRIEKFDWWKQELPSKEEREYALENLKNHNNEVDLIVTHTCCNTALKILGAEYRTDDFTEFLEKIYKTVKFNIWVCGHMHTDFTILERVYFLYKGIYKLEVKE